MRIMPTRHNAAQSANPGSGTDFLAVITQLLPKTNRPGRMASPMAVQVGASRTRCCVLGNLSFFWRLQSDRNSRSRHPIQNCDVGLLATQVLIVTAALGQEKHRQQAEQHTARRCLQVFSLVVGPSSIPGLRSTPAEADQSHSYAIRLHCAC